jgi:hypothetical protein
MNEKIISDIKWHGKTAKGKKELIKHLEGGRLTLKQAVNARCYDCTGFYADGKVDCRIAKCPLYPFMSFNADKSKRTTRTITEDHTTKMRAARGQQCPSFALAGAK